MKITSSDFSHNSALLEKFSCYGDRVVPSIAWENFPANTKSFVCIFDDPDAVGGTCNHWIVYDIPASITSLKRGALPKGAKVGQATNGKAMYVSPCPPKGTGVHRYRFTVYALDKEILNPKGMGKEAIMIAMKTHLLAEGILIGLLEKKKKFLFF